MIRSTYSMCGEPQITIQQFPNKTLMPPSSCGCIGHTCTRASFASTVAVLSKWVTPPPLSTWQTSAVLPPHSEASFTRAPSQQPFARHAAAVTMTTKTGIKVARAMVCHCKSFSDWCGEMVLGPESWKPSVQGKTRDLVATESRAWGSSTDASKPDSNDT
eukprot:3075872-Rhodomonas_salina.1